MAEAVRWAVYYVLFFFWLLLVARLVADLVRAFGRSWRGPRGGAAVALETVYVATDPPLRLLRKVIPTVRIGGVGLDLSITVLFIVVYIGMQVARP